MYQQPYISSVLILNDIGWRSFSYIGVITVRDHAFRKRCWRSRWNKCFAATKHVIARNHWESQNDYHLNYFANRQCCTSQGGMCYCCVVKFGFHSDLGLCNVFYRSSTGIVDSNPILSIDVCLFSAYGFSWVCRNFVSHQSCTQLSQQMLQTWSHLTTLACSGWINDVSSDSFSLEINSVVRLTTGP